MSFSLSLTRLVHENLSIVMCFAYSRRPLAAMTEEKFKGEWKYLNKALFDVSEERAEKALIELALFLRLVDDEQEISDHYARTNSVPNCGRLIMQDGSEKILPFREVANKILHSSQLEWDFSKGTPWLLCHSKEEEKWLRAEVDIVALAAVCGSLGS